MKINHTNKILIEKFIHKGIEVDSPYGYEVEEVLIDESAIKSYIDVKYDANEIINLARKIDDDIKKNDINTAYDILIDYYVETSSQDDPTFDSEKLEEFYDYIEKRVQKDYADEAQEKWQEQQDANAEYDDFEQSHMRD